MLSAQRNLLFVMSLWLTATSTVSAQEAMDHSKMQHESMPGMSMDKDTTAAQETSTDMSSMKQDAGGMDGGAMSMQGGKAPPDARDPHAYAEGEDFGPIAPPRMGDVETRGALLVDRFEAVHSRGNTATVYDLQASLGRDYDRAVLKAEGVIDDGKLQEARTELLWGHALTTFWDTQLGVRFDSGAGTSRQWLAFGIQGLAPYWFDVEATAYLGEHGRTAVQLMTEYDVLLTQKLILQPRIEGIINGKRDAENEQGSGLSELSAGVRLRYEVRREFAPYIGVEWAGKFGGTANYARAAGEDSKETRIVAGLRFWY